MKTQWIRYDKDASTHVATITFDRPEKLNAFTLDMQQDIADCVDDANMDDDIKVVLLKGNGRAFSTGQDLEEVGFLYGMGSGREGDKKRPSQRRRLVIDRKWARNQSAVAYCQKITVAQVHGYCIGSGFEYFLASDLTVVAQDAILGHPGRRLVGPGLGFNPQGWFWKLGPTLAKYMAITGNTLTGREAFERGLTLRCVPESELAAATAEVVGQASRLPGDGIVMGKAAFQMSQDIMGMALGYSYGYLSHTLSTNVQFSEGEHNFFRERRDKGAREAFHERDEFFTKPTRTK